MRFIKCSSDSIVKMKIDSSGRFGLGCRKPACVLYRMASSVCPVDQRKAALRVLQVLQQIAAPRFFTSKYVPGLEELHPDVRNAFTNAVVDGSLVAIRAFNEFLIPKKKYPDDLHWSDFPGFAQQVQFLSVDSNKELHKS